MTRRKFWLVFVLALLVVGSVLAVSLRRTPPASAPRRAMVGSAAVRHQLFEMLRPVAVTNCQLERFGEPHDGGYLMCANLLGAVRSGYSYGISGYDKWGCDISTKLGVRVHQYDCFNTDQPACPEGDTVFHAECVGPESKTEEGRLFDTIENQIAKNGDAPKRLVMKIDVEGAEWDSFLYASDKILDQFDQIAVEFHFNEEEKHLAVVQRLKQFYYVAHIHFNNASCVPHLAPFPTWAYEVLFVSKRLGVADPNLPVTRLHPLDAPNNPSFPDCQPTAP